MKYELDKNSADFLRISAQFNGTNIKKIEVIQNIDVWEQFQSEIRLLNGNSSIDPFKIYVGKDGFEMKFKNKSEWANSLCFFRQALDVVQDAFKE
jgi:hypothetical protein